MAMADKSALSHEITERIPPRDRLLAAAAELFYRHGIKSVGVEAIAEAAATNKMTLYRHFASKDELVSQYLRIAAREADCCWDRLEQAHPGDALAQLRTFIRDMAEHATGTRGCPLANAAVELPEKDHPARRVIEEHKIAWRARLVALCQAAGLAEPELLADELNLMLEGARVTSQSVGSDGLRARVVRISEALIASHSQT
jgi:AcrR family transcriptional regulator